MRRRSGIRRVHRWLGGLLVVFVLILAGTGVALNHANGLGLDQRYVSWPWLLDAYGIQAPAPYAGMVRLATLVVVGDGRRAHVLLDTGQLVESIDLSATLPGVIERVGRAGNSAILQSSGALYRSDADVSQFEPWAEGNPDEVSWSAEVDPDTVGLEALQVAWRGQGLTVERVLLDLHSGRILAAAGVWLMDVVAVCMIVLALSGLILSLRRGSPENGRHR